MGMPDAAALLQQVMALPPAEREALALHALSNEGPFAPMDPDEWDRVLMQRDEESELRENLVSGLDDVLARACAAIDARRLAGR